jgi:hypothetical protein
VIALAIVGVAAAAGVGAVADVGSADAARCRYSTWSIDRNGAGDGADAAAPFAVAVTAGGTAAPLAVAPALVAAGTAAAGVAALEGVGATTGVAPAIVPATAGNRVNPGGTGGVCPPARIGIKVTASAISTVADPISLLIPTSTCLSREVHCEKAFPFGQLLLPFQPRLSRCFSEAPTSWIAIWRTRSPRSPPGFMC